jgi:hypothetical protein
LGTTAIEEENRRQFLYVRSFYFKTEECFKNMFLLRRKLIVIRNITGGTLFNCITVKGFHKTRIVTLRYSPFRKYVLAQASN